MDTMWTFRGVDMMRVDDAENTARFGILLNLIDHGPPVVGGADLDLPKRRGLIVRPRYAKRRILTAEGNVVGFTSEDWRDYTDILMGAMDLEADPGPIVVQPPYLGYVTAVTLEARCVARTPGPIHNRMREQHWSFELEAVTTLEWEPVGSP